jgi:hypothetical protein
MLLAVAFVSLAAAVAAGAKTVTVTITKNGYVQSSLSSRRETRFSSRTATRSPIRSS